MLKTLRTFAAFPLALALYALLGLPACLAQNTTTFGNIVSQGTPCSASNCVYYQLPPGTPWVAITVTGTWSGTLETATTSAPNANYSNLGTIAWTALATETANGTWSAATSGATYLRVRATSWTSGSAHVAMASSQVGSPQTNPILPGTMTVAGVQAPAGGSAMNCWATDGTQTVCIGPGSGAVQVSPTASQPVTQPPGTTLGVNSLNGTYYASQYQTPAGTGNNGIANLFASSNCTSGCTVDAGPTYATTEAGIVPPSVLQTLFDYRAGRNTLRQHAPGFLGEHCGSVIDPGYLGGCWETLFDQPTGRAYQFARHAMFSGAGINFGSPWTVRGANPVTIEAAVRGIVQDRTSVLTSYGVGDRQHSGRSLNGIAGYITDADEANVVSEDKLTERSDVWTGTVATSATGTQSLAVTSSNTSPAINDGTYLLDLTQGGAYSSIASLTTGLNSVVVVNLAAAVATPSTYVGTMASSSTCTVSYANAPCSSSYTLTTTSGTLATGVACMVGPNTTNGGDAFGTGNVTSIGTGTAVMSSAYEWQTGTTIMQGGDCGKVLTHSLPINGGGNWVNVIPIVGALSTSQIVVAPCIQGECTDRIETGPSDLVDFVFGYSTSTPTISTTLGSPTITLSSSSRVVAGASGSTNSTVVAAGVPANTTLIALSGLTGTLSANATATASGVSASFGPTVNAYPGAEIMDSNATLVNGVVTGTSPLTLAYNSVNWTSGDLLSDPSLSAYQGLAENVGVTQNTPFNTRTGQERIFNYYSDTGQVLPEVNQIIASSTIGRHNYFAGKFSELNYGDTMPGIFNDWHNSADAPATIYSFTNGWRFDYLGSGNFGISSLASYSFMKSYFNIATGCSNCQNGTSLYVNGTSPGTTQWNDVTNTAQVIANPIGTQWLQFQSPTKTAAGIASDQMSANTMRVGSYAFSGMRATQDGTTGSTTYSYACTVASNSTAGESLPTTATITNGNAALSGSNYISVNCSTDPASIWGSGFTNGSYYRVYRTVGGATQGVICSGAVNYGASVCLDTGLTAVARTVPTVDTSGQIVINSGTPITAQTGTGGTVAMSISPTLVTPVLGNATATLLTTPSLTLTGNTGYAYANGSSAVTYSTTIPYSALTGTPATGVSSVFGRTGAVVQVSGDYSASQISGLAASATTDTTNASNISSGTLADARLSSNVSLHNAANVFTQPQTAPLYASTIGTAIASATTIAPTTGVVHITGTAAITTITAPTGCATTGYGCTIRLIPDGLWTTATGGNIAIASTAVVSRVLEMTYDTAATKWYPSY